jgi:hypothetical protein
MINIKSIRKWHLLLLWPAALASIIYLVSAFTHPLMAWTGPQAKVMFPPSYSLAENNTFELSKIINSLSMSDAKMTKLVPYKDEVLLQITQGLSEPRRYFSITNNTEIINHDEQQAVWLAQHYLKQELPIAKVSLISEFSDHYPKVNRLLPVYHIQYDTADHLNVFIHTDTQALAGISNDWKKSLRWIFQTFHSFNWLNEYEPLRLLVISVLITTLIAMSITGILFLLKLKRTTTIVQTSRRWHRRLGWFITVPFLCFCISGFYHLWQSTLIKADVGMQLTQNLDFNKWSSATTYNDSLRSMQINQVSLLQVQLQPNTELRNLYRFSVSPIQSEQNNIQAINTREKRFKGQTSEKSALYIDADTGESLGNLDEILARQQAANIFNTDNPNTLDSQLVTHFGLGYDFRNKRLPVWRIESKDGEQIFIDPITHILVDKNSVSSRLEGYSFSFLHKWNMLTPVLGRFNRDMLILFTLCLIFLLTSLGLFMGLRPNKVNVKRKLTPKKIDMTDKAA